jgi:hypothetical protein
MEYIKDKYSIENQTIKKRIFSKDYSYLSIDLIKNIDLNNKVKLPYIGYLTVNDNKNNKKYVSFYYHHLKQDNQKVVFQRRIPYNGDNFKDSL